MPLNDKERDIVQRVVSNFLHERRSTSRGALLDEFGDPGALNHLDGLRVLDVQDNRKIFLPTVIAFHYCGNPSFVASAKLAMEVVARGLKVLLRANHFDTNKTHIPDDLRTCLADSGVTPDPNVISLGLFLVRDFVLLQGYSAPKLTEVESFQISEHVLSFRDTNQEWDEYVEPRASQVDVISRSLPTEVLDPMQRESRKIFVVHGHDEAIKQSVARFLEKLNLRAVILHEQPNRGQTVIEKFEANSSDVGFAVVLLTPDDVGRAKTEKDSKPRARQNVILELGYFVGKLQRAKVCALYKDGVELPSDIHGVIYIPYDDHDGWRMKLAGEIREAGITVDMNNI